MAKKRNTTKKAKAPKAAVVTGQSVTSPPARGRGRPTEYKPAFCDEVIEFGREGCGKAEIAYELGVVRQTIDNWTKAHPEFMDAMSTALDLARGWWAKQGRLGIASGKSFNAQAYSFQVRNRFPDEWREKVALTDGDGGALTVRFAV